MGKDVADGTKITIKATSNLTPSVTATYELTVKSNDYVLSLKQENIVYSNAKSAAVADGKLNIETADTTYGHTGIYLNDDKSELDLKQYAAIKINVSIEAGKNQLNLAFVAGAVSSDGDASKYGGGTKINSKLIELNSDEDLVVRTDRIQPEKDGVPVALDIRTETNSKVKINSITFLKECPYESENLNIGITEADMAFTDAKSQNFHDGQCDVTLAKGQKIGFYIKPDKSNINPFDYYAFDYMLVGDAISSSTKSAFVKDVNNSDASSNGGGTVVGIEYTANVVKKGLDYFKSTPISPKSFYKIPDGSNVNVVYITNTGTNDVTFTIKGLRLNKYEY